MKIRQIKRGIQIFREQGLARAVRVFLNKLAERNSPVLLGPAGEPWTEYMNWLTFANAGILSRGNLYCFDYAIRNLPSTAPIVEIGSFCGLATNMITYLKEKYDVRNPLVTCDKWIFQGAESGGMLGWTSLSNYS